MKTSTSTEPLKILIAAADVFVRDLLEAILKSCHHSVESTQNREDAFDTVKTSPDIDLVIIDPVMPEMNGLTMVREFREQLPDVPLIILSEKNEIETAVKSINEGADEYVIKDENIQETITMAVKRAFEKNVMEKRLDALMKTRLPDTVVEEMKHCGFYSPKTYDCTILMFDCSVVRDDQTPSSGIELIPFFDELYLDFDRLIRQHLGIIVKTIGNIYMAAFGAPETIENHAPAAVKTAVSLMNFIENYNTENKTDIHLRAGIHSGHVTAAVVGKEHIQFELLGKSINLALLTVNIAEPGKICISENTFSKINDTFSTRERKPAELKEQINIKTYEILEER